MDHSRNAQFNKNSQSVIRCEGGWLSTRYNTADESYMIYMQILKF